MLGAPVSLPATYGQSVPQIQRVKFPEFLNRDKKSHLPEIAKTMKHGMKALRAQAAHDRQTNDYVLVEYSLNSNLSPNSLFFSSSIE